MLKTLEDIILMVRERKTKPQSESYTNKLLANKELSVEKVKEEVKELIEAVENNTNKVHETADVLYHLIVYLEANNIKIEDVMKELDKRNPGSSKYTTQRKEDDEVEILSGIFEGKTTGTPIGLLIRNNDQKSKDYDELKDVFRPSHADYVYSKKYGDVLAGGDLI